MSQPHQVWTPVGELSLVCDVLLEMSCAAEFAKAYSVRYRVFSVILSIGDVRALYGKRGDMVAVGSRWPLLTVLTGLGIDFFSTWMILIREMNVSSF